MAVFGGDERSWARADYWAIATGGVLVVATADAAGVRAWLDAHAYTRVGLDCGRGFDDVRRQIDTIFDWEGQFGYRYRDGDGASLDALRDGFGVTVPDDGGAVLDLERPDLLWRDQPRWTLGLLEIAREHSRTRMMEGLRFFALAVVDEDAPMLGARIDDAVLALWRPRP